MKLRDLKLLTFAALVMLVVALFGAFHQGVDGLLRDMARPDTSSAPGAGSDRRAAGLISGTAGVITGDRLEIGDRRVRLHGIAAPAPDQTCTDGRGETWRCGRVAAWELRRLIAGKPVTCVLHGTDGEGLIPATCSTVTANLNAGMVLGGYALADRRDTTRYVPEESVAKHQRRGLWEGTFTAPWDQREDKR